MRVDPRDVSQYTLGDQVLRGPLRSATGGSRHLREW
jgi:hypothetical protein